MNRRGQETELIGLVVSCGEVGAAEGPDFIGVVAVDFGNFEGSADVVFELLDSIGRCIALVLDTDRDAVAELESDLAAACINAFTVFSTAVVIQPLDDESAELSVTVEMVDVTMDRNSGVVGVM